MKFELYICDLFIFRYDLDLPVILDYEIWKASNMLFQNIPYDEDSDIESEDEDSWDDHWDSSERRSVSKETKMN